MADLALGLAKSTVEGTLSLVKTAMTEEDNLQMAVKKDLMLMTDEFEMMRSFLTVSKGRATGDDMARTLVRQVRDMSLDMEDCVEYVVQYTDKSSWLRRLLPRWHCLPAARPVMCLDEAVENIELLKARVESLGQRKMRYNHVGESAPKSAERTHQQAMAFKTTSQGQFVRRNIDGKVNTRREEVDLVDLIIEEKYILKDAIVVWATRSDVGITLISKAFDHTEVLENFLYRAWVQVKQPFNSLEFIQSVLAQFFFYNEDEPLGIKDLVGMETDHCLLMEEYLKRVEVQKYLIVIEGISSIVDWESVLPYLPARDDGRSRILVYTQQPEIASHIVQCPRRISHLYDTDPSVYVMYQTEEEKHEDLIKETTEAIEEYAREWLENYRYIGPDTYNSFQRSVEDMACLGHVHSIWGIPGVGKSFIAEYIYRTRIKKYADRKSTGEFTMFGWTHVYRPLNLKELASELLQDLQPISFEEKSILRPDDPIEWCRQFLQVNAYCLIVIDGVESTDEWDLIKHAIAFGETCSTFIVTTREENVAKYCATSPELVWNVKCLEAHHAFDLYKDEAYGPRFVPNHLQTRRMKFILEKCGGLPQMIVTVARYLRYDILEPEDSLRWIRLCDRFVHELHNSDELRGLFNWMDSYLQTFPDLLKPCLFYLSVFPPKISIRRSRLMRRWIAEGYCRDANQEQEETALEMFRQLVKMNVILQHIWSEIVIMPLCRLNGFFREYMKSKSMEEDLVFALEGRYSKDLKPTGRHLTVGKKWDRKLSLQVMKLLRNENFIICKSKVPKKLEILRLCLTGGGEFRFHRNEKIFMMQQFVNDPGYLKVLDIACNSKLKAIKSPRRFAPHIRVLKFRCCGVKSSLYFCDQYLHREGHHDNPIRRMMRLEEVWLGGTYDVAFKEYLESGIASSYSRRKPVLRLVEELLI